jgi:hypothetical protein
VCSTRAHWSEALYAIPEEQLLPIRDAGNGEYSFLGYMYSHLLLASKTFRGRLWRDVGSGALCLRFSATYQPGKSEDVDHLFKGTGTLINLYNVGDGHFYIRKVGLCIDGHGTRGSIKTHRDNGTAPIRGIKSY